jgi:acyl dehydratase
MIFRYLLSIATTDYIHRRRRLAVVAEILRVVGASVIRIVAASTRLAHHSVACPIYSVPVPRRKDPYVRFSDLTPGVVIRTPPRLVAAKEAVEFASRYDPQWFHVDPARASAGRWKGLIASGWLTSAIAMEMTVQHVLAGSEAFGSSGVDSLKWIHPVRPEDTVALRFEVLRSSKSPSGRTGILLSKSELWNQTERLVFTMQGTTLFDISK